MVWNPSFQIIVHVGIGTVRGSYSAPMYANPLIALLKNMIAEDKMAQSSKIMFWGHYIDDVFKCGKSLPMNSKP